MGTLRVGICLIDEHDDEVILSKRLLESVWTVIPENIDELKIPSNVMIEEISSVMSEHISYNLHDTIASMIEELLNAP